MRYRNGSRTGRSACWSTVVSDIPGSLGTREGPVDPLPRVDEPADRPHQVPDRCEGSSTDGLAGDDREERLREGIQLASVGVKCRWIRGCSARNVFTSGWNGHQNPL